MSAALRSLISTGTKLWLDSIDPDGAADRFPELASDPKFWIDMALFIAVLNFLSSVGPQDPFPSLPMY